MACKTVIVAPPETVFVLVNSAGVPLLVERQESAAKLPKRQGEHVFRYRLDPEPRTVRR